jgi:phosphatidylglycerol phospholipase C
MPRLKDLLEFLTTPGLEEIWVLLDIKLQDDPDDMMRLIAETLAEVKPTKPWEQRIVLGCWAVSSLKLDFGSRSSQLCEATYLPLCSKYLSEYPITHIGFSIPYARQFLKVPNVSFNMQHKIIAGPGGSGFLKDAKAAGRSVFLWTVDDVAWMKWCIAKGVDGVITDDPKTYLEVCKNYGGEKIRIPFKQWGSVIFWNIMAALFSVFFRIRFGFKIDPAKIKKSLEA